MPWACAQTPWCVGGFSRSFFDFPLLLGYLPLQRHTQQLGSSNCLLIALLVLTTVWGMNCSLAWWEGRRKEACAFFPAWPTRPCLRCEQVQPGSFLLGLHSRIFPRGSAWVGSNSPPQGAMANVLLFLCCVTGPSLLFCFPNPFPRVRVGLGFPSVQKSVLLDVITHLTFSFHDNKGS